jgi:hypothetical protein
MLQQNYRTAMLQQNYQPQHVDMREHIGLLHTLQQR